MYYSKLTEVNKEEVCVVNKVNDENLVTTYYLTTNLKKPQGKPLTEMSVFTGNAQANSLLSTICKVAADAIFPLPCLFI